MSDEVLAGVAGLRGATLIAATIPVSYLLAVAAASCVAPGRTAVRESFLLLQGFVKTAAGALRAKLPSRSAYH